METSPLIKAHDHAKAASVANVQGDTTVAINEHTRAAGEFSNAAKSTTSVEALRTLKLLEDHHRKLSELLKPRVKPPTSQNASQPDLPAFEEKDEVSTAANPAVSTSKSDTEISSTSEKSQQAMPKLPKQHQYPSRDLGASIANNLASARGIRSKYRSQPLSPSVSNAEAPGNLELAPRRSGSGSKSKMQNMLDNSERPIASEKVTRQGSVKQRSTASPKPQDTQPNEDGFSKWYSAFGSIVNRISGPLAFAGLPLVQEEQTGSQPSTSETGPAQKKTRPKSSSSTFAESPDLNKIYSKAALRAISRDGQIADSFCVVPPSGHTASYASILSFADKEKRRMETSVQGDLGNLIEEPDEEDFVDAKESQVPSSPSLKRRPGKYSGTRELANVVEELAVENTSLKDMLDKLSKRLHAFESTSQNSGMRLAESMRLMRPSSPLSSGLKPATNDEALIKRNRDLEEQLSMYGKQMEELQKDYNRARANLIRYREKWEQLKAGAKARRAGGAQGSSESNEAAPSSSLG